MPPLLALVAVLLAPVPSDSPAATATPEPVPSDSPSAPAPVPKVRRFAALVLREEGPALADLGAALALRVPDVPIVRESPTDGAPFVFVAVKTDPAVPVRHQIGVITSDGAAYFREVDTGAEPPVRLLASVLANLLVSIAEGTVRPDRTDVAIPPPDAALPGPEPAPETRPEPEVTPDPPPVVTTTQRPVPKDSTPAPRPTWEYAVVASGGVGVAIGPPRFGRAVNGGGGSLGLDARGPRGALFGVDVRGLGRAAEGYRLARLRVTALAGYALRVGRFELPVALGVSVEPWWVSPVTAVADTRGARPLIGAVLRASPGLYVERPRGPLRGLRIGPRLELAGSFLVDDGARVGGVARGDSALFRLGGLELGLGLEIALWFGRR